MISIDGAYGEGGGQMLRLALSLSTLSGKPFRVHSIRQNRQQPGLKPQHLHAIKALRKASGAQCIGAELGSQEVEFTPGEFAIKKLTVDVGTAGSLTLLMQCLILPALLMTPQIRLRFIGGTDVQWSPLYQYFEKVILPLYWRFGKIQSRLVRRGFYPKGTGEIELKLKRFPDFVPGFFANQAPSHWPAPLEFTERGELLAVNGISFSSSSLERRRVAERQATGAKRELQRLAVPVKIRKEYSLTSSVGTGIVLWGKFSSSETEQPLIGADSLGEKHIAAEDVGLAAARKFIDSIETGGALDQWVTDASIPLLALLGGRVRSCRLSAHTRSSIYVCEQFLDTRFHLDEQTIEATAARE